MKYKFYANCVGWPKNDVDCDGGLCDLIDAIILITRRTFLSKIDKKEFAKMELKLAYVKHHSQGLTMSADWHVSYFKSKLHGNRVYGFSHSAIEYVYTEGEK